MADADTAGAERTKDPEKAVTTLLAGWLLVHELADDWVRDAIARGRAPDPDPVAALAAAVDSEKARLRDALAADVGKVAPPAEMEELGEALAAFRRRLDSIEARLDGLSSRRLGQG